MMPFIGPLPGHIFGLFPSMLMLYIAQSSYKVAILPSLGLFRHNILVNLRFTIDIPFVYMDERAMPMCNSKI